MRRADWHSYLRLLNFLLMAHMFRGALCADHPNFCTIKSSSTIRQSSESEMCPFISRNEVIMKGIEQYAYSIIMLSWK